MGKITYHTQFNDMNQIIIDDIDISDDISVLNLDAINDEIRRKYYVYTEYKLKYTNINIDFSGVSKIFPQITKIIAEHARFQSINIRNSMFPNVKYVRQDGITNFLKLHPESSILCNIFGHPDVIDLATICQIQDFAFEGIKECNIINTDDVFWIEKHAFDGSWLEEISKNQDIVCIGSILIYIKKDMKNIEIPENVSVVKDGLEFPKELESITMHCDKSIKILQHLAGAHIHKLILDNISISNIPDLSSIIYSYYITVDEFVYEESNDLKIENGLIYSKDGNSLLLCPSGMTGDIRISDNTIDISAFAFTRSKAKSVVIPDSVKTIGNGAFTDSEICNVHIGSGIDTLSTGVFYNCKNLKSIDIPSNVKIIGQSCFQESGIESVTLHEGLERICSGAFHLCKGLHNIELPDSLITFGSNNFEYVTHISTNHYIKDFILNLYYNRAHKRHTFLTVDVCGKRFYLAKQYTKSSLEYLNSLFFSGCINDICKLQKTFCKSAEDKQYIAYMIYRDNPDDADTKSYLKRISAQLAEKMIQNKDTENLLKLLSFGFISAAGLEKLYDKTDDAVVKAYISQALNTDRPSVAFRL